MKKKRMAPVHPGEILLEQFLKPLAMSQNKLAIEISVPPRRINEIVKGRRRVTADTAMRLARFFRMTPEYWMGLQADYDLDVARDELEERIESEVRPCASRVT
ncbi:MAG: HigA family addiction module antidote protein [Deltaproteobacteria bacterium]|jgi:antitoxin HigA-1|nr:HigA family addiction module antidote protein [Deltaproteobacteria bacterium]